MLAATDSSNGNWTYSYDQFNRLVGANNGAAAYSYVYDRFGNRWQQNGPQSFVATFTGNNPSSPANNNRIDGYTYDSAGNLIADGSHTYTYDAENRLISVDNGNTSTFTYDGEGRRFSKTNSSSINSGGGPPDPTGTNEFVYDAQGRLVHTENSIGNGWRAEIWAGNRHLATYLSPSPILHHADWLGTLRNDDFPNSNAPQYPWNENYSSLPFGDWFDNTLGLSPDNSPLNFTGQYHDFETDLDYFGARYYASASGRFTSPDPTFESAFRVSPQTWNRYSYTLDNPVNYIDPDGELWQQSLSGTWDWMDKCNAGATCVTQIAQQEGNSVVAYGPSSAKDKKTFAANKQGYVNVADIAATDGAYFQFQAGVTATYASPQTAVDLYNGAFDYHLEYPNDSKLSLNDVGISTGHGFKPHQTHNLGRSVDMSYMDGDGKPLHRGDLGVWLADDDRMRALVRIFTENGFNQNYSDNDVGLGVNWAPNHMNHIHFGKNLHTGQCEIGPCQ